MKNEVIQAARTFSISLSEIGHFRAQIHFMGRSAEEGLRVLRKSGCITKKEFDVLMQRQIEGKTLHEVGKKMELTRERIRQIEAKALEIVKHASNEILSA